MLTVDFILNDNQQSRNRTYIPQRAPFIMIDNLTDATPEKFKTDFLVLHDNIFVEDGILREFALIENIAQSSSAGLVIIKILPGKNGRWVYRWHLKIKIV